MSPNRKPPAANLRRKTSAGIAAATLAAVLAVFPRIAAAETIRISGTGGAIGSIHALGDAFRKIHPDVNVIVVPSMGSSGGIQAVLAGKLDIGLSARPLNDGEREAGAVETRYALTPFVFGVHRGVRAGRLALSDAAAIYAGKRERWENGSRIRLVLRPSTESDIAVLQGMSPAMAAAVAGALQRPGMIMAMTDQDAANAIESVPGTFGAVTLSIVVSEKRPIRVLPLDGIAPSVAALAEGVYPYSKPFFMVTRANPSPSVRRFLEFVRSPAGAALLAKNGQLAVR